MTTSRAVRRVLGIDPGSRVTGYGVIDVAGNRFRYVASGCIRTSGQGFADRLTEIYDGLHDVIDRFGPGEVAIEQIFMARNAASALKLGHARGVALAAVFRSGLEVNEYAARQVKQAVVGTGRASKHQVQHMVTALLCLDRKPSPDAADALAIAICHVNTAHDYG